MIRPQTKKRKRLRNFKKELKRRQIVTIGGIIGKIAEVQDNLIQLKLKVQLELEF
ncbi:MAG: preprotein translocase subunit YajC [Bacteroidetes bacterium]|nr:preprotein translocase subunit YajC [Bacteroidota bacterium]